MSHRSRRRPELTLQYYCCCCRRRPTSPSHTQQLNSTFRSTAVVQATFAGGEPWTASGRRRRMAAECAIQQSNQTLRYAQCKFLNHYCQQFNLVIAATLLHLSVVPSKSVPQFMSGRGNGAMNAAAAPSGKTVSPSVRRVVPSVNRRRSPRSFVPSVRVARPSSRSKYPEANLLFKQR